MQILFAIERRITRTALELAVLALGLVVALTFYQVVTRFVIGHPSTWSEVAARSVMMWMVFLGLAWTFRHGAMVAVDFLLDISTGRFRILLLTVIGIASLIFLLLLIWFGTGMALRVQKQNLAGLSVSIAWVYAALPAGSLLAVPGVIVRLIEAWQGKHDSVEEKVDDLEAQI